MLVGVRQPKSAVSELMGRMQQAPASVRTIDADDPEPVERVIERCLQPEAANRYQSAEELASDLACLDAHGQLVEGGAHANGNPSYIQGGHRRSSTGESRTANDGRRSGSPECS